MSVVSQLTVVPSQGRDDVILRAEDSREGGDAVILVRQEGYGTIRDPEEDGARAFARSSPGGVQPRLPGQETAEQYVSQQAWRSASLPPCSMHPARMSGFSTRL